MKRFNANKSILNTFFVTAFVMVINTCAYAAGGANAGGMGKFLSSIGYENFQAILQSPVLAKQIEAGLEITNIQRQKVRGYVYRVEAGTGIQSQCIVDVSVENGPYVGRDRIYVNESRVIEGCESKKISKEISAKESIQAILSSSLVHQQTHLGLEITGIALRSKVKWDGLVERVFRVESDNGYRNRICIFDVSVSAQGHVNELRVVKGCVPMISDTSILKTPLRLACNLHYGITQDTYLKERGYQAFINTDDVTLEYAEVAGSQVLRCTRGCDLKNGREIRNDSAEIKGLNPVTPPFPEIKIKKGSDSLSLTIGMSATLDSEKGKRTETKEAEIIYDDNSNIRADFRIKDQLMKEYDYQLAKIAKPGHMLILSNESWMDLSCDLLKPGQVSEAESNDITSQKPAPGTISLDEYEKQKGNLIHNREGFFLNAVKLAAKIDPVQLKAKIASENERLAAGLRRVVPALTEALKQNPDMTNEEAWARTAHGLGINAMSGSGIVGFSIMPLFMVEKN